MSQGWDFWGIVLASGIIGAIIGALAQNGLDHLREKSRKRSDERARQLDLVLNWESRGRPSLRAFDLRGADLHGIDLSLDRNVGIRADLSGANLEKANLTDAKLFASDLSSANLRHALLVNADLVHVRFQNADLREACLRDAEMLGANLTGADLTGADLTGASLMSAILTKATMTDQQLASVAELGGAIMPHETPSPPPPQEYVSWDTLAPPAPGETSDRP